MTGSTTTTVTVMRTLVAVSILDRFIVAAASGLERIVRAMDSASLRY